MNGPRVVPTRSSFAGSGSVWTFQDLPAGRPLRARRARGPIVDARFMGSLQDAKAPERLKSRGLERFFSPQAPFAEG